MSRKRCREWLLLRGFAECLPSVSGNFTQTGEDRGRQRGTGAAHSGDQTKLYSRKGWDTIKYTEAQITADPNLQILSPFAAFQQQSEWIFRGVDSGAEFPMMWGVLVIVGLTLLGWIFLAWKHPRVRGA